MNIKREKGITLVALIVTIIVLLILAGVSISLLAGENGILTKVKDAKQQVEIENYKEEINMAILEEQINAEKGSNLGNKFKYENVWQTLRNNDSNLKIAEREIESSGEKIYVVIYKGYKYQIDQNGEVTYIGDGEKEEEIEKPIIPEPTEYKITYYKNDGTDEKIEQIVEVGKETILPLDKFTKGGYTLEGWYENAETIGNKIESTNESKEVYAKWIPKTQIEDLGSTTVEGKVYTNSYEIWNKQQLKDFRDNVNGLNGKTANTFSNSIIVQKATIDLNSEDWIPIGNNTNKFSGTYNGEENTINGIKIESTEDYVGLFGYSIGTIKNLTVDGTITKIEGSGNSSGNEEYKAVGGIAGKSLGTIQSCTNKATIIAESKNELTESLNLGGIVGNCGIYGTDNNISSKIDECTNEGTITVTLANCRAPAIGGIIGAGWNDVTEMSNLINRGNITVNCSEEFRMATQVGGIIRRK